MTARLSPGWLHSEGACIETALSGRPVPILDLQFAIAWQARDNGLTGVRLPDQSSGRNGRHRRRRTGRPRRRGPPARARPRGRPLRTLGHASAAPRNA